MALARDFRELEVYRLAFAAAQRIYRLSQGFPPEERYSLTDQIRKASRSVCTNIAEAWRKRRYPASFAAKLSDADGEAAETTVWLDFAFDCGFIGPTDHAELKDDYDHINRQLCNMMDHPEPWCRSFARPTRPPAR